MGSPAFGGGRPTIDGGYQPPTPGTFTPPGAGGKGGGNVSPPNNSGGYQNLPAFVGSVDKAQLQGGPYMPDESGGRSAQPAGPQPPNQFALSAQALNDAYSGTRDAMGYSPMMISGGSYNPSMASAGSVNAMMLDPNATDYKAAQFQQSDLDKFMNPYTRDVIDQSMGDIERGRLMQANQAAAQAQAAGAFGGSRGALMEAEIARNALDKSASTAANLRNQGFQFASQMGQQDVARRQNALSENARNQLQASLANQSSDLQAGMTNARLATQASLANANAANMAQQFGLGQDFAAQMANQGADLTGAQFRLNAANQLGSLGNLGFNMAGSMADRLGAAGGLARDTNQAIIDRYRNEFDLFRNAGAYGQNLIGSALGVGGAAGSTTTTKNQPGWANTLIGILGAI
ncbi:MAG: hypothetical protein Unbinned8622contig1005_34 [Prokaryotic dsDNA virus sp.]|nr:MAG: hypothetical protein Unbinned8622contig1005_34 [Prokaryotic dsDNA virus sp.]|tara:strand:+ start:21732 stop:22943 length:1212 start_codon:yes stop_codon:yes gene_type:complete